MDAVREFAGAIACCVAGAFFALVGTGAFAGAHVPLSTYIDLLALAVLSFAKPFDGLLVFIAISPIAAPLAPYMAPGMNGQLFAELLLVSCLAGTLLRLGLFKHLRRRLNIAEVAALMLIALTAASALVALGPEYVRLSNGEAAAPWAWHLLSVDYFAGSGDLRPLYDAMPLIEGLTLFVVLGMFGRPDSAGALARMLVVGAAAAAAFNVDKLLLVLVRTGSVRLMMDTALQIRISTSTIDLNAAGSYFAMGLVPALALLGSGWLAIVPAGLIAAGEALAGSRTAFAAIAIVAVGLGVYYARRAGSVRRRAVLLSAVVLLGIAAVPAARFLAYRPTNLSAGRALDYRVGMWLKAAEMTKAHPLFGVGIGEFATHSPLYEPTEGVFGLPENAHNQFLQIVAELGLSGLLAFVAIIAAALLHRYDSVPAWTVALGVTVFLLSALGGHPLLIRTVAYAFWTALAIANLGGRRTSAPKTLTIPACILAIALAATIPVRTHEALDNADFEHVGSGVSRWMTDEAGHDYRVASSCATLFVPTSARRIEITMRPHSPVDASLSVELWENGRAVNRIALTGREWTTAVFTGGMPDAGARRFSPIELRVWRNGTAVPCGGELLDVQKILALP